MYSYKFCILLVCTIHYIKSILAYRLSLFLYYYRNCLSFECNVYVSWDNLVSKDAAPTKLSYNVRELYRNLLRNKWYWTSFNIKYILVYSHYCIYSYKCFIVYVCVQVFSNPIIITSHTKYFREGHPTSFWDSHFGQWLPRNSFLTGLCMAPRPNSANSLIGSDATPQYVTNT